MPQLAYQSMLPHTHTRLTTLRPQELDNCDDSAAADILCFRPPGQAVDVAVIETMESDRKLKYHRIWQWADRAISGQELFPDTPDIDRVLEVSTLNMLEIILHVVECG